MTMLVVGIVLIVGGLAFAVYPLLRRTESVESEAAPGVPDASARRDAPRAATVGRGEPVADPHAAEREELALDRAMGKLSDDDYARLLSALDARGGATREGATASTTALTSGAASGEGADETAETATEARPENVAPDGPVAATEPTAEAGASSTIRALEDEAERLVREARASAVACSSCGPRPEPGARFCSSCGRAIGGCPRCGAEVRVATARFCDQCGGALHA